MSRVPRLSALALALVALAAGCSSDPDSSAPTSPVSAPTTPVATDPPADTGGTDTTAGAPTTITTDAPPTTDAPTTTVADVPLRILVTNDDGFDAPGIDAVVEHLRTLDNVEITVVAPAVNQSGAGGKITEGSELVVSNVMTASGYPATAVAGYPADSVRWALDGGIPETPDLIISGSNSGQNYATLLPISGTVGAAAAGAQRGIPAIAISQGFPNAGQDFDFPASVAVLSSYLVDRLADLRAGEVGPLLVSINVPTCPATGTLLDLVEAVPAIADNGRIFGAPSLCDGNPAVPADDVDAFNAGHPVQSNLDPTTLAPAAG